MELWKWWIPAGVWRKKRGALMQSCFMSEDEARQRYPGCQRVEGSRFVPPDARVPLADEGPKALAEDDRGVKVPRGKS